MEFRIAFGIDWRYHVNLSPFEIYSITIDILILVVKKKNKKNEIKGVEISYLNFFLVYFVFVFIVILFGAL